MTAGYSDGFAGRKFRAIEGLRTVASALNQSPAPADASNSHFDNGFAAGYHDGRSRGARGLSDTRQLDPATGGCGHLHSSPPESLSAQEVFCDGYRRGYLLGQSDALAGSPYPALAARK